MTPPVASVRCQRQVVDHGLVHRCFAFLVDVEVETADGVHLEVGCAACEQLELVNVVQQLWRRKGAA